MLSFENFSLDFCSIRKKFAEKVCGYESFCDKKNLKRNKFKQDGAFWNSNAASHVLRRFCEHPELCLYVQVQVAVVIKWHLETDAVLWLMCRFSFGLKDGTEVCKIKVSSLFQSGFCSKQSFNPKTRFPNKSKQEK